jgi:hypothetical protein
MEWAYIFLGWLIDLTCMHDNASNMVTIEAQGNFGVELLFLLCC